MVNDDDPLVRELRRWGYAQVNRYFQPEDSARTREHAISKAREFAPMTRERAAQKLAGRDGFSRRALMAQKHGVGADGKPKMAVVPEWAVDPVPCTETRNNGPRTPGGGAVDLGIPDELRWVDRAIRRLAKVSEIRALVLRTEFTTAASYRVKAKLVEEQYGGRFSADMYRRELALALEFVRGGREAA